MKILLLSHAVFIIAGSAGKSSIFGEFSGKIFSTVLHPLTGIEQKFGQDDCFVLKVTAIFYIFKKKSPKLQLAS